MNWTTKGVAALVAGTALFFGMGTVTAVALTGHHGTAPAAAAAPAKPAAPAGPAPAKPRQADLSPHQDHHHPAAAGAPAPAAQRLRARWAPLRRQRYIRWPNTSDAFA